MKSIVLSLCGLFFAASLWAQNQFTDHSTTVVSYFRQWEQKTYHVKRQQYKSINGQKNFLDDARYNLRLTVVKAAEDHYAIDALYTNFSNASNGNLNDIPDSLMVRYGTDEMGSFWQIVNADEVSNKLVAALEKVPRTEQNAAAIEEERQKRLSKDYLEEIFIKDIRLLHLPYGMEYDQQNPIVAPTKIPNLLGGKEPFPGTVTIALSKIDTAKKWAKVIIEQQLDQSKLSPILQAWT
ncbi:MAG TPA: hypothetical protein PKH93_14600, partial [Chitinophagales bacterium]|nr:hypothetical protein [Chitinophagales bacterium]